VLGKAILKNFIEQANCQGH